MNFLSQVIYGADAVIEFALIILLLRARFQKHIVFAFYVLAEFAADVSEWITYYRFGWGSPAYRKLYWIDRVTLDLLLFLVVIAFTYSALQDNPLRRKAAKALGVIVAVTSALPFAMLRNHHSRTYGFFTSQWFNHAIQIWSFGAAIMNLVLWTALLSNRRRDPQLVTLSIGVGIATSTAAIVWGARQWLSQANRWPVDNFMTMMHLASLLLWCWAFRPKAKGNSGGPTPPSSTPPGAPAFA
jgi:hypothetical protein